MSMLQITQLRPLKLQHFHFVYYDIIFPGMDVYTICSSTPQMPGRPYSTHSRKQSSSHSIPEKTMSCNSVVLKINEDTNILYSTISRPSERSKRFTRFALPDRPVHSDTNSASPGSILAMQQLRATTKSLTFPPLFIAGIHLYS